jgi:hypothetical protein
MVIVVVGLLRYTAGGDSDVILGNGFPPAPSRGMLMGVFTPVTVIIKVAARFPIAEGVKVMPIWQVWLPEMVPRQGSP